MLILIESTFSQRTYEKTYFVVRMDHYIGDCSQHGPRSHSACQQEWFDSNIGHLGIFFLDFRTPSVYKKGHVPGTVYTSYKKDGWRVKKRRRHPRNVATGGSN